MIFNSPSNVGWKVGNGETYDAADCEEPDYHHHHFSELSGVSTLHAIDGNGVEELKTNVEVEDRGDAYGAEEAYKDGLALFFDLVD